MKVLCSLCGIEGILETRGNSQRILHYQGFTNGKRIYVKHKVVTPNGNKSMGINNLKTVLDNRVSPLRSSSSWLGHKPSKLAIPGSSPGDRTKHKEPQKKTD